MMRVVITEQVSLGEWNEKIMKENGLLNLINKIND